MLTRILILEKSDILALGLIGVLKEVKQIKVYHENCQRG